MKVWVLAVSNSEGCCRPDVFDSKAKAVAKMAEDYMKEVEIAESDEEVEEYNPIEDKGINTEEGWAYIQYSDNHVDFNIYEEEVK
jgi:hypothetical protein